MDYIISFFIGILLGSIAGLIPGIHPNLIAFQLKDLQMDSLSFAIILVAASAANVIFSFIPMIFLFIPNEIVLSVLPGHLLAKGGHGLRALKICILSAFIAVLFLPIFIGANFLLSKGIFVAIKPLIVIALIAFSAFAILSEGRKAVLPFLLSGALGYILLTYSKMAEPVFVAFLGFFSLSALLLSKEGKIPEQRDEEMAIRREVIPLIAVGCLLGWVCDFFPAIGSPAQMATLLFPLIRSPESFLAITSAISTSHTSNSIVSLVTIGKARTGVALATKDIISSRNILFFVLVSLTALLLSIFFVLVLAGRIVSFLQRTSQQHLRAAMVIYILAISLLSDGLLGLFVLLVSTAIGIFTQLSGARRTNMMAFLLLPVIINSL
jgi:putative membrane protein